MLNADCDNLTIALELFVSNFYELQSIASRAVTRFDLNHHEVILICAAYTDFWKEFIDEINPEAADAAAEFVEQGIPPVYISAYGTDCLLQHLKDLQTYIELPDSALDPEKVWLMVLHERGHTWLQLPTCQPGRMLS